MFEEYNLSKNLFDDLRIDKFLIGEKKSKNKTKTDFTRRNCKKNKK